MYKRQDLVDKARDHKLDPVIGRDSEIRNVVRILSRKTKNNPVLIGEPLSLIHILIQEWNCQPFCLNGFPAESAF